MPNIEHNQREILAVNNAEYFTCINWKPLGNKERFEFDTKQEAINKGKSIIKDDKRAKITIYAVNGSNMALVQTIRGS